jgi:hypothetical protein
VYSLFACKEQNWVFVDDCDVNLPAREHSQMAGEFQDVGRGATWPPLCADSAMRDAEIRIYLIHRAIVY